MTAALRRKVQKPVYTIISEVLWKDSSDDVCLKLHFRRYRRLPVCIVTASSSLVCASLSSICLIRIPLFKRTVSKAELGHQYDAIDKNCNLAHRVPCQGPWSLRIWPLALQNGVTVTLRALWLIARIYSHRLRATRSLAVMSCYSMVCEMSDVKEVKRWKALTSGQANDAQETGVSPRNLAVRSSLLWACFLLSCLVALFFAGFP